MAERPSARTHRRDAAKIKPSTPWDQRAAYVRSDFGRGIARESARNRVANRISRPPWFTQANYRVLPIFAD
jgi:hypothetical protein